MTEQTEMTAAVWTAPDAVETRQVPMPEVPEGWALVRSVGNASVREAETVDTLRRGGWAAVAAPVGSGPAEAWSAALGLRDDAGARR